MFEQRDWSWRRRFAGLLAVFMSVGLLGVLPVSPAQAQTQRPLLLIGGTFATATGLDVVARPYFESKGYDVDTMGLEKEEWWDDGAEALLDYFSVELGIPAEHVSGDGTASIDQDLFDTSSVDKIGRKVDQILAAHPEADKVDIIGHSQGASAARWYLKDPDWRGVDKVHTLISLGGAERGVQLSGLTEPSLWWFACRVGATVGHLDVCDDMLVVNGAETEFLRKLNAPDATPGNVRYFHLYVADDGTGGFEDLGFESELVDIPGALHEKEWEYPEMRSEMLERLQRP
jgi:hypothetical protein